MKKVKYKDIQELIDKVLQNEVKTRIAKPQPPMEVNIDNEIIDSIENLIDDNENEIITSAERDIVDSSLTTHLEIETPTISKVSLEAYSQYFDESKFNTSFYDRNHVDVSFPPALLVYQNKILEFRMTSLVSLNLYDAINEKVAKLATSRNGIESEVAIEYSDETHDVLFDDFEKQVDVDEFVKDGFVERISNVEVEANLVIYQEPTMVKTLNNSYIRQALINNGIHLSELTGKNTEIFINGEKLLFEKTYEDLSIIELLANKEYRLNYDLINNMERAEPFIDKDSKNSKTIDINEYRENLYKLIHNEIDADELIEKMNKDSKEKDDSYQNNINNDENFKDEKNKD